VNSVLEFGSHFQLREYWKLKEKTPILGREGKEIALEDAS
jgi:hypothetical protein